MEKQIKNPSSNSFQASYHRLLALVSHKHRKQRINQLEIKKRMDRILEIKNKHPELSKYLNRIPEFLPNMHDSELKLATLRKYNDQLLELLEKYTLEAKKIPV